MKKSAARWGILWVTILAVYSVVVFALPFSKGITFWISYLFALVAIAVQIYVIRIAFSQGEDIKSKFYGFPIARVGAIYLVAQLIASLVFMATASFLLVWIPVVISVIFLGIAAVGFVAADAMRDEVIHQESKLEKNTEKMRQLCGKAAGLVVLAKDAEVQNALRALADEFRYSDPVSSESLQESEASLDRCLEELRGAILKDNKQSILPLVSRTKALLAERNSLCKLNKG